MWGVLRYSAPRHPSPPGRPTQATVPNTVAAKGSSCYLGLFHVKKSQLWFKGFSTQKKTYMRLNPPGQREIGIERCRSLCRWGRLGILSADLRALQNCRQSCHAKTVHLQVHIPPAQLPSVQPPGVSKSSGTYTCVYTSFTYTYTYICVYIYTNFIKPSHIPEPPSHKGPPPPPPPPPPLDERPSSWSRNHLVMDSMGSWQSPARNNLKPNKD